MAEPSFQITADKVEQLARLWEVEIGWPLRLDQELRLLGLDRLDVLHVLKTGEVIERTKETDHAKRLEITGTTCGGTKVRILAWSEPSIPRIRLREIQIV